MSWIQPDFSRGEVDRAGHDLILPTGQRKDLAHDLEVIDNWRSSHSYPLQVIKMNLLHRADGIARRHRSKVLITQRLKRLESIAIKLADPKNPHMQLTQMQDIGGCRAVLRSMNQVRELLAVYEHYIKAGENHELRERYDYLTAGPGPKDSGYRSFHYVYKYRSTSSHRKCFDGLRIEIQIRTRLQHAWATAVETVDALTRQALKSNVGKPEWIRFFALMSSVIAIRERLPTVPGTPTSRRELSDELQQLATSLRVEDVLMGYGYAATELARDEKNAELFLVVLDPVAKTVTLSGFTRGEYLEADEEFRAAEKNLDLDRGMQAVLIGAKSFTDLRHAYPNLYLDTTEFVRVLKGAIRK